MPKLICDPLAVKNGSVKLTVSVESFMFKLDNELISELGPDIVGKFLGKLTLLGIIGKGVAPGIRLIPVIELNPES